MNRRPGSPGGPRRRQVDPARRVAFDALRRVHADDGYANLVLDDLLSTRRISGRDAAFATELLFGTCRLEGSYDQIIAAAAGRKLTSFQPAVLDVLRLGAHQLLGMRVPRHAAVDASADLAGAAIGERVVGLVNAVLRRVGEHDLDTWLDRITAGLSTDDARAVRGHHPRWIADAYAQVLPADEVLPALAANNESPRTTLAVRPGVMTRDELLAGCADATATPFSPYGAVLRGAPGEVAAVRDGRAGVQDEGSQLVTLALARAADAREPAGAAPWLDLCAGPGGKAALLTGLAAERGGWLLAVERAQHRAKLVGQALRRYPGRVIQADGTRPAWAPGSFSAVLADVPCTGLGALRRRPEARWRRDPASLPELVALQQGLLRAALDAAQPGGVVAYVTCSPHPAETTEVVQSVLAERGDVTLLNAADWLPEVPECAQGPFVQLWPHRHGTDAMFLSLMRSGG